MSLLLALDSSTETMALALSGPQGCWSFEGEGGAQASSRLLPEIMALLAGAGLGLKDLDAIAFGRGPGAFTGLRTACAVAQGLAFGAAKPVLAIDSLMLVAEDARAQSGGTLERVWVAMDARMGEIYGAAYRHDGERWQVLVAPALYTPGAFARAWAESPAALCGSALGLHPELHTEGWPRWPVPASRAVALASLARQAWQAGERLDPAEAIPLYVRDKVALTTEERAGAKAGA